MSDHYDDDDRARARAIFSSGYDDDQRPASESRPGGVARNEGTVATPQTKMHSDFLRELFSHAD